MTRIAAAFHDYMSASVAEGLRSIPDADRNDIYAISFLILYRDEDARQGVLMVGYNTESRVGGGNDETRWNYAFWLQNDLAFVGDSDEDPEGARLREAWIHDIGLWYEVPDEDSLPPGEWETAWDRVAPIEERLAESYSNLCVGIARDLHQNGTIELMFGRSVPVIVHELEELEKAARYTQAANPPGVADDFVGWVRTTLGR